MIIANKYEVPDKCPENCIYKDDFINYGQSATCGRCPVFVCSHGVEKDSFALVEPENYRPDWAEEWEKFFKGEVEFPTLYITC